MTPSSAKWLFRGTFDPYTCSTYAAIYFKNAGSTRRSITIGRETKAAALEATKSSKTVVDMVKELKGKAPSARNKGI